MATTETLIVGASGKTGRRVADRLRATGRPVRAASRSGATRFDWNDPSTWEPALRGTSAAYVTYFPDLAFPGAAETVGAFADLVLLDAGTVTDRATWDEPRLPPEGIRLVAINGTVVLEDDGYRGTAAGRVLRR